MPVKMTTPLSEIDAYVDAGIDSTLQAVISMFTDIGLQCITEARDHPGYMDQTGNLRSSIGYAVVVDGHIVGMEIVEQVKDGTEGKKTAETFLARLASEHPSGISLVVVAGMNYAVYVEGRGKNVLTSAELLADRLVPQMLEQLGFTVKRI